MKYVAVRRIAAPSLLILSLLAAAPLLAQAGGTRPPDEPPCTLGMQDYIFQGPFPGQSETDAVQYHTEGYGRCYNRHPDWCPSAPIGVKVRGTFHKSYWMSASSGSWLASSTCDPYVHNMKTADGRVVEYACADFADDAAELIWEVLPDSTGDRPRSYRRSEGGVWKEGFRWGNLSCQQSNSLTASVFWSHLYTLSENRYRCTGIGQMSFIGSASPKGGHMYLGPTLIGSANAATVAQQLKNLGVVPSHLPVEDVIPPAWYGAMPQAAGRGGLPVYLTIRKDYLDLHCGSLSCDDWIETYWYLTIAPGTASQFGLGLVRWNVQSRDLGLFYNSVVLDTLVTETSAKTQARPLCQ